MPAPSNLPDALFRHAASHPEEPWLFRAEGWDWRWHSWGEVAREVSARARGLSGIAAGCRYAFPYAARPEAVILDLAIQAAGLVAAPGPPPEPSPPRPSSPAPSLPPTPGEEGERKDQRDSKDEKGRKRLPPGEEGEHQNQFVVKAPSLPVRGGGRGRERGGWGSEGGGGAVVLRNGEPIELSSTNLIAMAQRIQEQAGPTRGRDVVVLSGSIELPEERAMLSWATLAGAAVVLEPNPALRVATAAWVRPTVFHGTAAELVALRKSVEKERRGWLRRAPRPPFRRLRTILVTGPEALRVEEETFWSARGVRICRIAA